MRQVRGLHRELQMIRRLVTPTKYVIEQMLSPEDRKFIDEELQGGEEAKILYHFSAANRAYIREILDNVNRVGDLLGTYTEICVSLETQYMQQQDKKTNKTMYTLAVVSTVFLPITFLAGNVNLTVTL
jgi:magnesium transporter